MRSSRTRDFRQRFAELPPRIKETAKKNYELWKLNPLHPSLEFKEVKPKENIWSLRPTPSGPTNRYAGAIRFFTTAWVSKSIACCCPISGAK